MIHYTDDWLTVLLGDCRVELATLPAESVHCVVTSPPYWGLRDYGQPGQLGLEPTPDAYIEAMVGVFREVKRVLRRDGTCWVNMGDGYASAWAMPKDRRNIVGQPGLENGKRDGRANKTVGGLKEKDLIGMPWRLAFALQADGWYLRSDIIWSKPNPMPESVTDRPTKSHEYLFLLTRSPRYYYDADAVREGSTDSREQWLRPRYIGAKHGVPEGQRGDIGRVVEYEVGRNLRSVWTIATQPYPGAHFATFPEALVEPCVKAGTSERGVCPECGAPWVREVTTREMPEVAPSSIDRYGTGEAGVHRKVGGQYQKWLDANPPTTTGWAPGCDHRDSYTGLHAPPIPATVLDPFAGSGTTARVANRLSRRAILIDLSADYLDQAMLRNAQPPLGMTS